MIQPKDRRLDMQPKTDKLMLWAQAEESKNCAWDRNFQKEGKDKKYDQAEEETKVASSYKPRFKNSKREEGLLG